MTDLATMWSSLRVQLDAHRPGLSATAVTADRATPVTILSGFLGAGKSTLLARLLTEPAHGFVVRAVVNDVGALPFDPTLVTAAGEVEIELSNGCGCCESTADLAATLDRLAADSTTDLVVLEASGVADPLALAQVVEARPGLTLDRIVVAVDGRGAARLLDDPAVGPIARRQLDAAHAVVITNADRLAAAELDPILALAAEAAPGRVITFSTIDEPAASSLTPASPRGAAPAPALDDPDHDLATITITPSSAISRADLERLLAQRPAAIVRAKGRLRLDDGYAHVQLTSTSVAVEAAEAGECGFTIVATTTAAAAAFARSISGRGPEG